jgi:predicted  nucleic acid-binding Zn-ribbon protein
MSKLDEENYRRALRRQVESRWRVDRLRAELTQAETEYHNATQALDELEIPSHT